MIFPMAEASRCSWCGSDPQYVAYHDTEWGVPVRDPQALFAKLTLDAFQSGLSWLVVLRKRATILRVMDDLDPARLARWDSRRIEAALADPGIIRHRGKIEAAVANARHVLTLEESGRCLGDLLWSHVGGSPVVNHWERDEDVPSQSSTSRAMARELRSLGFAWTGPTVCYAFMQAVGMINDHLVSCFRHPAGGQD